MMNKSANTTPPYLVHGFYLILLLVFFLFHWFKHIEHCVGTCISFIYS